MATRKKKKKFGQTTLGKIVGGAAGLINPALGELITGSIGIDEAIHQITIADAPIEDKIRVRELLIEAYEAEVRDRVSARQREAVVAAAGGNDILFKVVGFGITTAFLIIVAGAMGAWEIPTEHQRMYDMAFGAVVAKMTAVVSYYFGSSIGSKQKTEIMKGSDI